MNTIQAYARVAGVLNLVSIVAGAFGESYVPSRLIAPGDPVRTAANMTASDLLFRLGVAAYLVEAMCDVALALLFYVLLRAAQRELALLAAFFGLVGTAVFAVGEVFYLAGPTLLAGEGHARTLSPGALEGVVLLSLRVYGLAAGVSIAFYGVATVLRGYLIVRSGYLPRWVGVLLACGGLAFVARTFMLVLAPGYGGDWLFALLLPGGLSLMLWLLVKGVDVQRWQDAARPKLDVAAGPR